MEDSKTFICKWTDCSGVHDSTKTLYEHYVEQHLVPQQTLDTLKCSWKTCQYQAANLSSLRSHGLRHIPYRQYACTQCGRTFKWKHDRNKHFARLHTKQQPSPMMSMYQNLSPMYMNQMMGNMQNMQQNISMNMNQMNMGHLQPPQNDYRSTSPSPNMNAYASPQLNGFTAPQLQMFDFMSRGVEAVKSSPNLGEMELPPPEEDIINFTAF